MTHYINRKIEVRKRKLDGTYSSSAITLNDFSRLEVREGTGNRKDSFSFKMLLPRNNIYETYFIGDGSTTAFTLDFGPIDSDFITGANQKAFVFVDDVAIEYDATPDAGKYKIATSTLTFGTAPADGAIIKVEFPVIESMDLIRIYQAIDDATLGNDNVLMEGVVDRPEIKMSPNNTRVCTIKGFGIIEQIFGALVFIKDVSITTPEAVIQSVITQINNYNRLRTIYGENGTEWGNLSNDTTSADIQYVASYKSALEIIEDVSSDRYTKDGNYYYYVTYNATEDRYEFHWNKKSQSLTAGLSITEGEPTEMKIYRSREAVINAIIYNVGLDCNEVPQEFLNYAQTSMAGYGTKWKYITATNTIISDLINQEFEENRNEWTTGANNSRTSNYPDDTSSWTFQFETRNDDGTKTGTNATASTDATFNDAIVEEAMWLGKEATNKILDMYQAPRIKCEATYPFTTAYSLGNLVPVTSESFNLNNYPLRVVEIKHDDDSTTIYLEEDEFTAIERLIRGS